MFSETSLEDDSWKDDEATSMHFLPKRLFSKLCTGEARQDESWAINAEPKPRYFYTKVTLCLGRGGGIVVSVLAYCSNDPSSNPAGC